MKEVLKVLMHMGSLQRLAPMWILGVILMIVFPSIWNLLALVYGFTMQIVVEYMMHRFIYHREPPAEQSVFNDLYRSHIGHHEFPNNPNLFAGDNHWYAFKFGTISFVLHTVVFGLFFGFASAALFFIVAIFVGSATAFAYYEYCHTLAHLKVPKGWFGRQLTITHMRHHFNDHDSVYHVSFGMGWVDRLFGTSYSADKAKERFDPKTLLSLGMDPEDLRLATARKAYGLPDKPSAKETGESA